MEFIFSKEESETLSSLFSFIEKKRPLNTELQSNLNEKILEYFEAFFTKEIASSFISKIYPDEDKIRFSNQKRKFNNLDFFLMKEYPNETEIIIFLLRCLPMQKKTLLYFTSKKYWDSLGYFHTEYYNYFNEYNYFSFLFKPNFAFFNLIPLFDKADENPYLVYPIFKALCSEDFQKIDARAWSQSFLEKFSKREEREKEIIKVRGTIQLIIDFEEDIQSRYRNSKFKPYISQEKAMKELNVKQGLDTLKLISSTINV